MTDQSNQHDQTSRHVRTTIPDLWHRRLAHASTDLGIPRHELLREAVLVLLHGLGHGDGIRLPNLPQREEA